MSERTRIWLSDLVQRLDAGDYHFERHRQQWTLVDGPAPQPSEAAIVRELERERKRREPLTSPRLHPAVLPQKEIVVRLKTVEAGAWFTLEDLADKAGLPCQLVLHARRGVMSFNVQAHLSAALLALDDKL